MEFLKKIGFYGPNMLSPDIPGTPIYRAKWLPPRIPVNRGPTVLSFTQDNPILLLMSIILIAFITVLVECT